MMSNSINYTTGEIRMNWNNPPDYGDVFAHFDTGEPSAVDRLAALEDPDSESAKRVKAWEERQAAAREAWINA